VVVDVNATATPRAVWDGFSNTYYVLFADNSNFRYATVYFTNASPPGSWDIAGANPVHPFGATLSADLAVDPSDGSLYVALWDDSNSNYLYSSDLTGWFNEGTDLFSGQPVSAIRCAFDTVADRVAIVGHDLGNSQLLAAEFDPAFSTLTDQGSFTNVSQPDYDLSQTAEGLQLSYTICIYIAVQKWFAKI